MKVDHLKSQSPRVLLFVGSYTRPVPHAPHSHGDGIHVFEVDFDAGQAKHKLVYPSVENPSYLCFDGSSRVLYAISELAGGQGGIVSALSFDGAFTRVVERTHTGSGGTAPCYVSLSENRHLLVANYGDGSVASLALRPDGHIESMKSIVRFTGSGPNAERQERPHAHCVVPHPSNGLVYAADLGTDTVYRCRVLADNGSIELLGETHVQPGSGPRHIMFDPSGNLAFLVHEMSSHLGVFRVTDDGALIQEAYLSLLPVDFQGVSLGADLEVRVSDCEIEIYATNRGDDSVVALRINPETGDASARAWVRSRGKTPRSLALEPNGRYLMVANQDSDSIQVFYVGDEGAELQPTFSILVPTPVCVKCSPLQE